MKTLQSSCALTLCCAAALAPLTSAAAKSKSSSSKPNIVIIYADDMGYGDMSCQNPISKIQTPNMDHLAEQGVRFTDGHSSSGVSSPSRYALYTGNYHWRRMHAVVTPFGESKFVPGEMTIARMLKSQGYKTAMVGKWHLGWNWSSILTDEARARKEAMPEGKKFSYKLTDFDWSQRFTGGPVDQGFDYYYGDGTINYPPYCWIENDRVVTAPTKLVSSLKYKPLEGAGSLREGPMAEDWAIDKVLPTIANKSIEYINNQDGKEPFFLMCSFSAPHAPIYPNKEFIGTSEAGLYGDFVVQCDDILGRIVDAIDKRGFGDNTIIVFTADNGCESYAYDRAVKYDHDSSGIMRGVKRDTWEGGHRVPFIIRWSDEIKGGKVCEQTISQVDLFSTFASLTGYTIKENEACDSYNMLPLLQGKKLKEPIRRATVHNTREGFFALRVDNWLLIDSGSGTHSAPSKAYVEKFNYKEINDGKNEALLFNLDSDVEQLDDLSAEYPDRVKQMHDQLAKAISSKRTVPIK